MPSEPKDILLVEDDPCDAELALEALGTHDLARRVELARDGEEALDFLNRRGRFAGRPGGAPVVVILDLKLPKVNGLEVLAEIRADDRLRRQLVVILSSSREKRDVAEAYRLGANAFVVKPLDFGAFSRAVERLALFWAATNEAPPVDE